MNDQISVTGHVGTAPQHLVTTTGLSVTRFRLGTTGRRFDNGKKEWVDGETNWYTVTAFRQLARHVAASIELGQRVVVSGRLRVRSWEKDDKHGLNVEIEADSIGHDLAWGTTVFTRSTSSSSVAREEDAFAEIEAREAAQEAAAREADDAPDARERSAAEDVAVPF